MGAGYCCHKQGFTTERANEIRAPIKQMKEINKPTKTQNNNNVQYFGKDITINNMNTINTNIPKKSKTTFKKTKNTINNIININEALLIEENTNTLEKISNTLGTSSLEDQIIVNTINSSNFESTLTYAKIEMSEGIYEGSLKFNKPDGKGKFTFNDNSVYEGTFENGKPNGKGIYKFSDGSQYSGCFANGLINGNGTFKWPNGINYSGNFINGYFNGKGTIKNNKGSIYIGDFNKGYFQGKGKYIWNICKRKTNNKDLHESLDSFENNNDLDEYYMGDYYMGKRNGSGLYQYKNGDNYIGGWKDGLAHGKGSFETRNKIYYGLWEKGKNIEVYEVVSKYQSGEIKEDVDLNFYTKIEDIDTFALKFVNDNNLNDNYNEKIFN